jgi:hypothetical protein
MSSYYKQDNFDGPPEGAWLVYSGIALIVIGLGVPLILGSSAPDAAAGGSGDARVAGGADARSDSNESSSPAACVECCEIDFSKVNCLRDGDIDRDSYCLGREPFPPVATTELQGGKDVDNKGSNASKMPLPREQRPSDKNPRINQGTRSEPLNTTPNGGQR